MNKIRFFAAATALCFTTQGFAADLIVMSDDAPDMSALNSQIYVQLLGGVALPHDVTFYLGTDVDAVDPTVPGYAVAGTLGVVVYDGLSVEADVLHTFRDEEADGGDTYATTSLMANLKYTAHLNDMFSVYGAVGVGHIWLSNFDGPRFLRPSSLADGDTSLSLALVPRLRRMSPSWVSTGTRTPSTPTRSGATRI